MSLFGGNTFVLFTIVSGIDTLPFMLIFCCCLFKSGSIKISERNVSLAAHLSTKCCEEVWKLAKSLQSEIVVTQLSRMEAWPKSFEASRPTDNNIALYFLPCQMRCLAYPLRSI
jgi:hypothetical protein